MTQKEKEERTSSTNGSHILTLSTDYEAEGQTVVQRPILNI